MLQVIWPKKNWSNCFWPNDLNFCCQYMQYFNAFASVAQHGITPFTQTAADYWLSGSIFNFCIWPKQFMLSIHQILHFYCFSCLAWSNPFFPNQPIIHYVAVFAISVLEGSKGKVEKVLLCDQRSVFKNLQCHVIWPKNIWLTQCVSLPLLWMFCIKELFSPNCNQYFICWQHFHFPASKYKSQKKLVLKSKASPITTLQFHNF